MTPEKETRRKPAIVVTRYDQERLSRLAESHAGNLTVSDELLAELDRARIVEDGKIGDDVIRMGSTLRFTSDLGQDRTVTLVFPGEADIATGSISVLTPIGVALIGLSVGQSIDWVARDGQVHRLTVESVEAPAATSAAAAVSVKRRPAS